MENIPLFHPLSIPRKGDSRCGSPLQTLPQSPLNIVVNTDEENSDTKSRPRSSENILSRQEDVKSPAGRPRSRGSPASPPPPFARRLFKEERAASPSPLHTAPTTSLRALIRWAKRRDMFSTDDAINEVQGMTPRRVIDVFAIFQTMGLIQGQPRAFEWTPAWKTVGFAAVEETILSVAGAYVSSPGMQQMICRFVNPFLCEDKTGFDPDKVIFVERIFPSGTRRVEDMIDIFHHFGFIRRTGKGGYMWIAPPLLHDRLFVPGFRLSRRGRRTN